MEKLRLFASGAADSSPIPTSTHWRAVQHRSLPDLLAYLPELDGGTNGAPGTGDLPIRELYFQRYGTAHLAAGPP